MSQFCYFVKTLKNDESSFVLESWETDAEVVLDEGEREVFFGEAFAVDPVDTSWEHVFVHETDFLDEV